MKTATSGRQRTACDSNQSVSAGNDILFKTRAITEPVAHYYPDKQLALYESR